jgi:AraC-like DNA-binding protein
MIYTNTVREYLRDHDLRRARQTDCAERLGISPNTLLRRLADEGTSYDDLRTAEQRRRVMVAVAENPAITGWELAELLGLSCSQSVVRFFQRVFGVGLTQYKRGGA